MYRRSTPEALNSGTNNFQVIWPTQWNISCLDELHAAWVGLWMVRKKQRLKKSLLHLNQRGNPVRMSKMLRTAVNISGLACHGLIKVYVKDCSTFSFSKHPHYLLFFTRYIIAIILPCPASVYMVDWKERKKYTLLRFYYWSVSFECLQPLGGGWRGEPKTCGSLKSSCFWTYGNCHLMKVRKKFSRTQFFRCQPLLGVRCWASTIHCVQ